MEVINATGRRKTAIARVYISDGNGNIVVNKKDYQSYFTVAHHQYMIRQPFDLTESSGKFDVKVLLNGGGIKGQAEALRLAISRALVKLNPEFRTVLKSNGLLTRDSRRVERKKPGQPGARKRFQFSKR